MDKDLEWITSAARRVWLMGQREIYVLDARGLDAEPIVVRPGARWPVRSRWESVVRWLEESQLP